MGEKVGYNRKVKEKTEPWICTLIRKKQTNIYLNESDLGGKSFTYATAFCLYLSPQ